MLLIKPHRDEALAAKLCITVEPLGWLQVLQVTLNLSFVYLDKVVDCSSSMLNTELVVNEICIYSNFPRGIIYILQHL